MGAEDDRQAGEEELDGSPLRSAPPRARGGGGKGVKQPQEGRRAAAVFIAGQLEN